jgi:hypothetical protein
MRGIDATQSDMFSYVSPENRVPKDHPLRPIRILVNDALQGLSPEFKRMYSDIGRPSIAPEKLLRALLLQILYTIRSERMLMEQLNYNLLFRWFVGLNMDDGVWDATVFSKNRDRMLKSDVGAAVLPSRGRASPTAGFAIRRAFFRGWDIDRGMGQPEEFSKER